MDEPGRPVFASAHADPRFMSSSPTLLGLLTPLWWLCSHTRFEIGGNRALREPNVDVTQPASEGCK